MSPIWPIATIAAISVAFSASEAKQSRISPRCRNDALCREPHVVREIPIELARTRIEPSRRELPIVDPDHRRDFREKIA
jgi:hypothetical protein